MVSHPCEKVSAWQSSSTLPGLHPNQLFCSAISLLFPSSPNQRWTMSPLGFYLAGGIVCAPLRMGRETQRMFLLRTILKWVLQQAGFHGCGHETAPVSLPDQHIKFPLPSLFLALTLNIPSPSQVAVPWWLVRPCHDLNGSILKLLAGGSAGSWQAGAGISPCPPGWGPSTATAPLF